MTEIILVRHGETEWNVEEIYRGRIDVKLNGVGVKQAELLGRYLSNLKLGAIYSSPLKRALDTANIWLNIKTLQYKLPMVLWILTVVNGKVCLISK